MYYYLSTAFRGDKKIHEHSEKLDNLALSMHGVEMSRAGFLELLNRWNRDGLLGVVNGGPIYVYTATIPL